MNLRLRIISLLLLIGNDYCRTDAEQPWGKLQTDFERYSGAKLVFDREELPTGIYHDVMIPLAASRRVAAAKICLEEARRLPPDYLGNIGLKAVGVFEVCVSKKGDGFRPYDPQWGGYRYFGIYNGNDAVAASFYSEGQLALTFHHEIYHHVDSTHEGETQRWLLSSDDAFYRAAISGDRPHARIKISDKDLSALKKRRFGLTLTDAVSDYAAKNPREDQAETARHMMELLPDALIQATERPELPGSQRILHVLGQYRSATHDGPTTQWFVDVALERTPEARVESGLKLLTEYCSEQSDIDASDVRACLADLASTSQPRACDDQLRQLIPLSARACEKLIRDRIRPLGERSDFSVFGSEDRDGVNWTLRNDIKHFTRDAYRLHCIGRLDESQRDLIMKSQLRTLRLLAEYFIYIKSNWTVTPGTRGVFQSARDTIAKSLSHSDAELAERIRNTQLSAIPDRIDTRHSTD